MSIIWARKRETIDQGLMIKKLRLTTKLKSPGEKYIPADWYPKLEYREGAKKELESEQTQETQQPEKEYSTVQETLLAQTNPI